MSARHRILVVDDNRDNADCLTLVLQISGHEVRVARTGEEALEAARDFRPRVVLLDIGLPGIDGHEVGQRLRKEHANLVLIAVTGYDGSDAVQRSLRAGFDHHIVKPVDPQTLRTLLGSLVSTSSPPSG